MRRYDTVYHVVYYNTVIIYINKLYYHYYSRYRHMHIGRNAAAGDGRPSQPPVNKRTRISGGHHAHPDEREPMPN